MTLSPCGAEARPARLLAAAATGNLTGVHEGLGEAMVCRRLFILVALAALLPAGTAGAHSVTATITPPASPPAEDSGFAIGFAGDVTRLSSGDGDVRAKIRPSGGTPCAPKPREDPGSDVDFGGFSSSRRVSGAFSVSGSYVAPAPGDYLICAWVEDQFDDFGPAASASMTVRPALQQISVAAPASIQRRVPFAVTVNYQAEVPRFLTVLVTRTSNCSISSDALRAISTSTAVVADDAKVSGAGTLTGTVRIDDAATYLVCAFFEESPDSTATAPLVVHAATIAVIRPGGGFRSCGDVGGRKRVRNVRARNVPCRSAKALARRWGNSRPAARRLGAYRCVARSGRVTCTAGAALVTFRFGRG